MPSPPGTHRRMLAELIRANATDKRWADETIAASDDSLEALENAAIGTADNQWLFPGYNGRGLVDEARRMTRI